MVTGKNPKLTANLLEEGGGELLSKMRKGNEGYFQTVDATRDVAAKMHEAAERRYLEALGDGGIDMSIETGAAPLYDEYAKILSDYKVDSAEPAKISKLSQLRNPTDRDIILQDVPEMIAEVNTAEQAMAFKQAMKEELISRNYFNIPDSERTAGGRALKRLYDRADDLVKDAAKIQGKQSEYETAKKLYGERKDAANELNKLFPAHNEKRIDSSIHSIENRANRTLARKLDKIVELEPELKPWLHDLKLASRASNLDNQIGVMQSDRIAGSTIGNMSIPAAIAATVLTRPAIVNPAMVYTGKAVRSVPRAIGDIAGEATEALTQRPELAKQIAKEGTRLALGDERLFTPVPREIGSDPLTLQDIAPELLEFAQTRYGSNYKRAIDAGMTPDEAALDVVDKLIKKGKLEKISSTIGVPQRDLLQALGGTQ